MPYARFDDRYDDHRKIKRALRREPAAVAIHAMAITYCNRHNTNGELELDTVEEWLALLPYKTRQKQGVVSVLLDLRLFEQTDSETFEVHDFLDWNLSREQRASLADQGRKGGQARRGSSPPDNGGSSHSSSKGLSQGSSPGSSEGPSTPFATPTPRQAKPTTTSLRSAVAECFAYWQERCDHPTAKLTADRRSKIEGRLREGYSGADIRKAIDGAARAAFVNDQGKRFDDIELICRNGSKLESFMARADAPSNVRPLQRAEALQRADAWKAGYDNGGAA